MDVFKNQETIIVMQAFYWLTTTLFLLFITYKNSIMSAQLDQLTADVTANTSAVQSAIVLIQGLKAQLDAAGTDPVALKALSDSLEASTQSLANAVAQNTPAQPTV